MRRRVLLLLCFAFLGSSLRAGESPAATAVTPEDRDFFEKKVRPLLVAECQKCHSTSARKQRGSLLLDSRSAILKGGDSGPAVVSGQPDKSLLIQAVHYRDARLQMPPPGKRASHQLAVLEEWVRRGVPFPDAEPTVATRHGIDLEKGRQFWSFQSPKPAALPTVRQRDWPRQRIDWFILAELEKHKLSPSSPASRTTWKPLLSNKSYRAIQ